MATIRNKGDFQWHVQIRKKGYPYQTKTFRTENEAKAWATVVESEMVRGVFIDRSNAERTSIENVIDRFTTEFAPHHYRQRNDKKEAWRYQCQHLKERVGAYSFAALDQKLVASYRDERLKDVGKSTVRKELYMLSAIIRFAEYELGIALPRGNPVLRIRKPADGKARARRLTQGEWERLGNECRKSRNVYLWPAVDLAVETAMRQGELLGLRWNNIDNIDCIALLSVTKNGEARAVPLSPRAMSILEGMSRSTDGYVLPVERLTLYHAFVAAVRRAKISNYTFHDLRHEAVSRMAETGDLSVSDLLCISGHKNPKMLMRYQHLQVAKLAKKLGKSATDC